MGTCRLPALNLLLRFVFGLSGNSPLPKRSGVGEQFSHMPLKSLGCSRVCILKYKRESLFFRVGAEKQHLGPSQTFSSVSEARMNPHHPLCSRHQLLQFIIRIFFLNLIFLCFQGWEKNTSGCAPLLSVAFLVAYILSDML